MTRILAIDPGSEQSAFLLLADGVPERFGIVPNDMLLATLHNVTPDYDVLAVEEIRSYGMAVKQEVFDTARWVGRFQEAPYPIPAILFSRVAVRKAICHNGGADDSNIRTALIDLFRERHGSAVGHERKGGLLAGITKDVWSALAVAITCADGATS